MSLCCTDVSKKIIFPLSALTLAIFSSTALADTWTCEQLDKLNSIPAPRRLSALRRPASRLSAILAAFAARWPTVAGASS